MTALLIGYARVSIDEQDLTAQRDGLGSLGVAPERIYVDHGLTGTNRERPGLREAKAKGRLRGKQPTLNPRQEAHLVALHRAGEHSTAELGGLFGVARSTVYRAIQRDDARAAKTKAAASCVTKESAASTQSP